MKCVRLIRTILGINQDVLCREAGIGRVPLSIYENGHVFPSRRVAKRLDDAMERLLDRRVIAAVQALRRERETAGPELQALSKLGIG